MTAAPEHPADPRSTPGRAAGRVEDKSPCGPAPRAQRAAGPLGSHASSLSPSGDGPADVECDPELVARVRRAERWSLLGRTRLVTSLDRVRTCRLATLTGTGGPTLRLSARGERRRARAGFAGLATCGSVWACPCCAPKVGAERASELADVMAAVHRAGGSAYLVTYTMRHHRGMRLADLWDAVSAAWNGVTSGKGWLADQAGMLGWARVVEVTHSARNGWHVHVHAMFAWSGQVADARAQRVALRGWQRWDRRLAARGYDSTPVHGVDARRVTFGRDGDAEGLGRYFTKAAAEITGAHQKDARAGGRTPFAILRDALDTYRADDLALLWEYEQASQGRRQLTWSTAERMDLRSFARLGRERTDEEIAATDQGGDDVLVLDGDAWDELTRSGLAPELLDAAELGGMAGATEWLDARELGWQLATPAPPPDGPTPRSPRHGREARAVLVLNPHPRRAHGGPGFPDGGTPASTS